jgi:hypothetical protein
VRAVADAVHGPRVRGGEVAQEVGRRGGEAAAGHLAGAGRSRACALVVGGLEVGDAARAAVLPVGALDPGGADDLVHQGGAYVGAAAVVARVAPLAGELPLAAAASNVHARRALHEEGGLNFELVPCRECECKRGN